MSKLRTGALAYALVFLASSVVHADAKDTRKQVAIKVKATDQSRTKKLEPTGDKTKKEEHPDERINADDFLEIENEQGEINNELIEEYKGAIADAEDGDPKKPEYMFRLAEAYSQQERHYHSLAMEAAFKADQESNKSKKAAFLREQQKNAKEEQKWLVLAVKAYTDIVKDPSFKTYARIDEVYFFLAYTLMQAKRPEDARKIFQVLTKQYPESKYIPDAYLALADAYFNENNLKDAEAYYDKVLKFPKNAVYPYALYKKGWVVYNEARPKDSYAAWIKVAEITNANKKDAALNRASKKDLVRAYAEFGDETRAMDAFKRVDNDFAPTMFEILGGYYLDNQGKFNKAIYVFRELIGMYPTSPKICDWEYKVVQAVISTGGPQDRFKEFTSFAKLYKFIKDKGLLKDAALTECRENAAGTVKEWAVFLHMEAVKTLNPTTLGYAADMYGLYQQYFPDADDSLFILYLYAELSWSRSDDEKNVTVKSQRWEETAQAYTSFVEQATQDPDKLKHTLPMLKEAMPDLNDPVKEAAYASVLAWQKSLAVETHTEHEDVNETKDVDKCKKPEPLAIDERQQKMIKAFDVYIKYVTDPKDKNLVEIKFFKARIYWKYKHYDEAIPLFQDIIDHHRQSEVAEFSANLILDSLNNTCNFDGLAKEAETLLTLEDGKFIADKPQLKEVAEGIKATSMRLHAQQLEKDGKFYECGTAYVNIFQQYQEASDVNEVLFNAGVCFEKAKSFQNAITMREALVQNFGTTREAKLSLFALGANYAAIAEYATAAAYYEKYAKAYGGEKDSAPALQFAVFFYKGIGPASREAKPGLLDGKNDKGRVRIDGDQKAIDDTEFFIKQYINKSPADAAAASYSIASIYEKNKKYDDVVKHLSEYIKRFNTKGGVDRLIIAHVKIGEILWRQSCPVRGVNGACVDIIRARKDIRKKKGAKRTVCGSPDKVKVVAYDRKGAIVKEAQTHFAAAIKLWKKGEVDKDIPGKDENEKAARKADMTYWAAAAVFYMAETDYEKTLRINFPHDLDFEGLVIDEKTGKPDKKSKPKAKLSYERFTKFSKDREDAIVKAKNQYMYIVNAPELKGGAAAWAIAAAARVGQMEQAYAGAIFTAEIPKDVYKYGDDGIDAYCDRLGELSSVLDKAAGTAYEFCLSTATERNWSNEWSQLCESELSQSDRATEFPPADEIRPDASAEPQNLATAPINTDLAK